MQNEFKCPRCGKAFKRKFNYENHVFWIKTPCDMIVTNTINGKALLTTKKISGPMVIDENTISAEDKFDYHEFLKFCSILKKDGKNLTKCKFCGKVMITDLEIKNHFLKSWCGPGKGPHELLDIIREESEKNAKKIEKTNSLNIYNTEVHNHINTQIINNEFTKNINIVNNIFTDKVNAFGKENLDSLTDDILDSIIENPDGGIVKLIKYIHFNPDVPENRNVVLKNKKDPYFDVFNGDYWEKQDKDTTIHNLISTKKDIMDDHFENMIEKKLVTNIIMKNYNDFSDVLDPYLKDNIDSLITEKLSKKNLSKKCESIYKKLYGKVMLVMMNDKEINKVLQRKLNKLDNA